MSIHNTILQSNSINLQEILNDLEIKAAKSADNSKNENDIIRRYIREYINDELTFIGSYAFCDCYGLRDVSFPNATGIGNYAFWGCTNLTDVSFPNATTIGIHAFEHCNELTNVSFPNAINIGRYAFNGCTMLTDVSFPNATTIDEYAFYYCTNLTNVSFPNATTIGEYAFNHCTNLRELYLTGSTLCTLSNSNAFLYTGITSSTGSIYVPSVKLSSYQTATNWVYFSTQFVGIDVEFT